MARESNTKGTCRKENLIVVTSYQQTNILGQTTAPLWTKNVTSYRISIRMTVTYLEQWYCRSPDTQWWRWRRESALHVYRTDRAAVWIAARSFGKTSNAASHILLLPRYETLAAAVVPTRGIKVIPWRTNILYRHLYYSYAPGSTWMKEKLSRNLRVSSRSQSSYHLFDHSCIVQVIHRAKDCDVSAYSWDERSLLYWYEGLHNFEVAVINSGEGISWQAEGVGVRNWRSWCKAARRERKHDSCMWHAMTTMQQHRIRRSDWFCMHVTRLIKCIYTAKAKVACRLDCCMGPDLKDATDWLHAYSNKLAFRSC